MKLIFNKDICEDEKAILAFIEGLSINDENKSTHIDTRKISSILQVVRSDFPHVDGIKESSVFKKTATLMVYFIAERPIEGEIVGLKRIPDEIREIPNYVNTVVAILIGFACLHNASITVNHNGEEKILNIANKIPLSKHSFIDLVDSLSGATPSSHFKIVSVLLEQLVYKSNPQCQYQDINNW